MGEQRMNSSYQDFSFRETQSLLTLRAVKRRIRNAALYCRSAGLRQAKTVLCVLCLLSITATVCAQKPGTDLTTKSIEDLMDIEVTSVAKKEEKLFQTPAAVYVITQEDIRRSGMTSLPDLLRLAPGLDVARIDGSKWAVSARGFNGRFANKLLVLIDGRSVYSPETSGVYWEVQDMLLEDIERIEIIRGPGGTLWGANAVNGVINIITKHTRDTQGGLVTAGSGSEERGLGSIRYGGKIGEKSYYRIYAKYFNRASMVDAEGSDVRDGQNSARGGGRADLRLNDRDSLIIEGDIYHSNIREIPTAITLSAPFAPFINRPGEFAGGNILGRWTRAFSDRSDMALQIYYDRFRRDIYDLPERINTFDMDFQHHFAFGNRHDLVWGIGHRVVSDGTDSTSVSGVQYNPKAMTVQLFSAFAQDELTLVKDRLRLMLGAKFERNHFSGFELQPGFRLSWTPSQHQTIWGSISRAVRTAARNDTGIRVNLAAFPTPDATPAVLALFGNPNFKSEEALAYEAGYRAQPSKKLSLDIATFYNSYDHLQTRERGTPFFEADAQFSRIVIPLTFDNLMRGKTYGAETSVNLSIVKSWELTGSYSFLQMRLHPYAESHDSRAKAIEGNSPQHQFQVRSHLRLPSNFELDSSLYFVSRLANLDIPSYARLDVRLGWLIGEGIELSTGGQNLLDSRRIEFTGETGVKSSYIKRSAFGKLTWKF